MTAPTTTPPVGLFGYARPEQSRARYPDVADHVERDGVRLGYEVYGGEHEDAATVLLMPTWSIVHSRHCPLPRASLPGARLRRPRQRTKRPATDRVRRAGVRRRRPGGAGRRRGRVCARRLPLAGRPTRLAVRQPASAARRVPGVHRPGGTPGGAAPGPRGALVEQAAGHRRRVGRSTTSTTGAGTSPASLSSSSAGCSTSPLDEAHRGRGRMGPRHLG